MMGLGQGHAGGYYRLITDAKRQEVVQYRYDTKNCLFVIGLFQFANCFAQAARRLETG